MAWLAAYVETDRFRSIDLELTGAHPRRAWLDGEGVVLGGLATEGAGAEAKGTLKLAPGKHTLLLETVLDVSRKDRWSAGAVLSSAGDLDGLEIGAARQWLLKWQFE